MTLWRLDLGPSVVLWRWTMLITHLAVVESGSCSDKMEEQWKHLLFFISFMVSVTVFNCDKATSFLKLHLGFHCTGTISKRHLSWGAILSPLLISCSSYFRLCMKRSAGKGASWQLNMCTDNTCVMMNRNRRGSPLGPILQRLGIADVVSGVSLEWWMQSHTCSQQDNIQAHQGCRLLFQCR